MTKINTLQKSFSFLKTIFYINLCIICKQKTLNKYPLCSYCLRKIKVINNKDYCQQCFLNFTYDNYNFCESCFFKKNKISINIKSYAYYNGIIKILLKKFKYYNCNFSKKVLEVLFIKFVKDNIYYNLNTKNFIIISVPIHFTKLFKRGFNQSDILAKNLSQALKIKYLKNCLKKIKKTTQQATLNKKIREQNLKNSFIIKNKNIYNYQNIILIDDIYTTGNTIQEIISTIEKNKPSKSIKLNFIVFCIASSKNIKI